MSSVLDRDALDKSPLADLHLIADELGVDGFRRLRKAELVDAIIARQSGEEASTPVDEDSSAVEEAPKPRRRSRAKAAPVTDPDVETEAEAEAHAEAYGHGSGPAFAATLAGAEASRR